MLTADRHAELVTLAGPDFSWPGIGSRPTSKNGVRAGLMAWLANVAGGTCAFCGGPAGSDWEACHVVSAGPLRRGFTPPNLAVGCHACNIADRDSGHAVVPYATILRPDLIPHEWPATRVLSALGEAALRDRDASARSLSQRVAIVRDRRGF